MKILQMKCWRVKTRKGQLEASRSILFPCLFDIELCSRALKSIFQKEFEEMQGVVDSPVLEEVVSLTEDKILEMCASDEVSESILITALDTDPKKPRSAKKGNS